MTAFLLGLAPAAAAQLCQGVPKPTYMDTCQSGWVCLGDGWVERYYTTSQNISCDDGNACTYGDKCVDGGGCVGTAITCTSTTCQTQTCNGTASCTVTNAPSSQSCNDNNACTAGDHCSGSGTCVSGAPVTCSPADACHAAGICNASTGCSAGALTCAPQVAGAVTGPSTSATGAYVISWGASTLAQSYNVFENGTGVYSAPAGTLSMSISGRSEGWYYYEVQACNSVGCSARTDKLAVAVSPPGTCGGLPKPPLDICQSKWVCNQIDLSWTPVYYAASASHMCDDGDACSSGDVCASGGVCSGQLSCPPNVPGAIVLPTSSVNGIYTIAWGASTPVRIDRYELYQNSALIYGLKETWSVQRMAKDRLTLFRLRTQKDSACRCRYTTAIRCQDPESTRSRQAPWSTWLLGCIPTQRTKALLHRCENKTGNCTGRCVERRWGMTRRLSELG